MSKKYRLNVALTKEQYLAIFTSLCHFENILMTRIANDKTWCDSSGMQYDQGKLYNVLEVRDLMSEAYYQAFASNRVESDA